MLVLGISQLQLKQMEEKISWGWLLSVDYISNIPTIEALEYRPEDSPL
jgi:hypothetical protein